MVHCSFYVDVCSHDRARALPGTAPGLLVPVLVWRDLEVVLTNHHDAGVVRAEVGRQVEIKPGAIGEGLNQHRVVPVKLTNIVTHPFAGVNFVILLVVF